MKDLSPVYYINSKHASASLELGRQLCSLMAIHSCTVPSEQAENIRRQSGPASESQPPVILCIGTDRVTGDSLGPLVGTFLAAYEKDNRLPVYGTLEFPVHALNLENTWKQIKKKHPLNPIVAVDASLGTKKHLGYITLGQGSLKPGAGVQKNLSSVGDFFITGIINTAVPEAQLALQNTRLSSVAEMACCIAHGLLYAFCPQALVAASGRF